jgi:hypothetical protein
MGPFHTGHCDWCSKEEFYCICLSKEDKAEIAKEAESVKVNLISMCGSGDGYKWVAYYKGIHFLAYLVDLDKDPKMRVLVGFDISEEEQENDTFVVFYNEDIRRVVANAAVRWDRYRKRIGYTKE